jgi:2-polyprenyl-6-methoxyphenol hydroxylase-like FAD-dependent oxidoreductase
VAAGLTLAIDLTRRGAAFRLIDMAEGPFQGSRGKGLQPRTLELFEDLGILDRIFARGGFYPLRRQYSDGGFRGFEMIERSEPTPATSARIADDALGIQRHRRLLQTQFLHSFRQVLVIDLEDNLKAIIRSRKDI